MTTRSIIVAGEPSVATRARDPLGADTEGITCLQTDIIGAHACVTDAYGGSDAAIGDRATIADRGTSPSIRLPGARIRHAGVRVEAPA